MNQTPGREGGYRMNIRSFYSGPCGPCHVRRMLRPLSFILIALASAVTLTTTASAQESGQLTLRERIAQRRAASAKPDPASPSTPLGAGTHTLQLSHQGQSRKYLVHVPPGYNAATPTPLVLAFHGGGGYAEFMADDARYGLVSKSDREGFVVVFPNGYSKFPGGKFATWNAGNCCGEARDRAVDDVGIVRAMVAQLKLQLNVDSARIFATGMSNGGMLSHRLACDAADVFRAVASVAGTDATTSCAPSRPISVLHIHARDDDHVLFNGGAGPGAFRDESKVMDFVSVPQTMARWVQRNQCSPMPRRVLDQPGADCETYAGCAGGVATQLCVTETGGHSWLGAQKVRRGKEAPSQALDADDVIWDFFKASASR
jgi:polyhydroxybutyrate depolymerase